MKKVIVVLLIISGITLMVVAVSIQIFPQWLAIPGGILLLIGVAFDRILDIGSKIKDWIDLVFGRGEKNSISTASQPTHNHVNESLRKRLRFLDNITNDIDSGELEKAVDDLVRFIKNLPHGTYYAERISKLTDVRGGFSFSYLDDKGLDEFRSQVNEGHKLYRQQLREARTEIYALIDELLRVQ